MSDKVKLIIEIPEYYLEHPQDYTCLAESVRRGTVLPKGHGRLIDADAICKDIISALGIRDENYLLEAEEAVYKRIKNADTIIEADRSERNNKE